MLKFSALFFWVFLFSQVGFISESVGAEEVEEDTLIMFNDMLGEFDVSQSELWQKPNYGEQSQALGYKLGAFSIPPGMEERVSFWLDIYTRFSTDSGLLHDSLHVSLVYEELDFSDIMKNENLSMAQKRRARRKRVSDAKKEIRGRLKRLQKMVSPAGLAGKDLRYWYLFSNIKGKRKFLEASKKGRLRFQLGQSDRIYKGIFQSGFYLKRIEEIFRSEGLPIELTRLPFVESSFNLKARSKVGASGIWQIMRSTGRRLLKINYAADERNDPIEATRAAARFLRSSYHMLGEWPLAVTGYNHGPSGVRRLVRRYGTTNLVEILDKRRGRFGFASANFYASFLAAVEVEKNADKYFGKVYWAKPQGGKEIKLSKSINYKTLIKWFDGNKELAKVYNPHLRRNFWKGWATLRRRNFIRVPDDKKETVVADIRKMKSDKAPSGSGRTYIISRGETLSHVAEQFSVTIRSLLEINNIANPRRIRAGQKLHIPK